MGRMGWIRIAWVLNENKEEFSLIEKTGITNLSADQLKAMAEKYFFPWMNKKVSHFDKKVDKKTAHFDAKVTSARHIMHFMA